MIKNSLILTDDLIDPIWKNSVERWYQLDQASKALCEFTYHFKAEILEQKKLFNPDVIIFGFQNGSNSADRDFYQSGYQSPSKFVYTLPNIPPQVCQQVLGLSIPTYCLSVANLTLDNPEITKLSEILLRSQHNVLILLLAPAKNEINDCWSIKGELKSHSHE